MGNCKKSKSTTPREPSESEDELSPGQRLVERLVICAEQCSGGVRVLNLKGAQDFSWIKHLDNEEAEWTEKLIQADTSGGQALNFELNKFRNFDLKAQPKNLKKALSSSPGDLAIGGTNFPEWGGQAAGSCAEMGSADAIKWAKKICDGTSVNWSNFSGRVKAAEKRGEEEEEKWQALKTKGTRAAVGDFAYPPEAMKNNSYIDIDDAEAYLKELYRLNKEKPVPLLVKFWKKEQKPLAELWLGEAETRDKSFLDWKTVRKS